METGLTKVEKYEALQRLELCIEMFESPMVRESDELEIDKAVLPSLIKANKDLGFTIEESKLSHLFDGIATEIKRNVPNIRLLEIPIAINKGILGDYGEFYGLSVVTVIKFLKAHYESEKRANLAKQVKPPEVEKQIPTEEEQRALAKIHLVDSFNKFKLTKDLGYSGVYLYRYLNKDFKAISFTVEIKWKIYYQAIISIQSKKETGTLKDFMISPASKKELQELRKFTSEYKDEIECAKKVSSTLSNKDLLIQIKNESERLAVIRLYSDLIEMEQEITDLLTE